MENKKILLPFRSAQFEHTVVVTSDGVDVLTKLPEEESVNWAGWAANSYFNFKPLSYLLKSKTADLTRKVIQLHQLNGRYFLS